LASSDLIQGPIAKTLVLFTLPMLGSNLLQVIGGSMNVLWIGHFLGEAPLAAAANTSLILFFVLGTLFGVGMATAILIGQAVGAGKTVEAKRVVGTSMSFFLLISLIVALSGFHLSEHILFMLGTPRDVLPLAGTYLRIIFIAVPVMNMLNLLMLILRGAGDARTPLIFMGLATAIDVSLNPILIAGWAGMPALGFAGSATATLLSQSIGVVAMTALLYDRRHPLRLTREDLAVLKPDRNLLWALLAKGVPLGLQMIVIAVSGLLLMGFVNIYGAQAAAAYGVVSQLWAYLQMPAVAVSAGVSTMVAQNVGAGRWDRVGRITRVGIIFSLVLTGGLMLLLYIMDQAVLRFFLPTTSAAEMANHINGVASWSFLLFSITMVLFGTVRAAGAVMPPLVILALSLLLGRVLFAFTLQRWLGSDAIWWSFPFGSGISLILAVGYYCRGSWRQAEGAWKPRD
jgi:putative MATE family efflux protein